MEYGDDRSYKDQYSVGDNDHGYPVYSDVEKDLFDEEEPPLKKARNKKSEDINIPTLYSERQLRTRKQAVIIEVSVSGTNNNPFVKYPYNFQCSLTPQTFGNQQRKESRRRPPNRLSPWR